MQYPPSDAVRPAAHAQSRRAVTSRLRSVTLVTLFAAAFGAACAPVVIPPERIAKIEVRNLTSSEKMMEGDEVKKLLEGMQCHEADFKWTGGYPATIFLEGGGSREVDGFSYFERVLRISRRQYCELGEKQWKAVFGELKQP